jgi:hypothetical protein
LAATDNLPIPEVPSRALAAITPAVADRFSDKRSLVSMITLGADACSHNPKVAPSSALVSAHGT